MGKINLLQPSVFNMIAAGEVVERPASVVKELAENSIDAGATVIDVTIEEGGCKRIQVSDNGVGIPQEDLQSAFLPHATSKLKNIEDLDTISTLGFRGEALASIASVSEITLVSRAKGAPSASKIMLYGGKVIFESVDSRAEGTSITVDNLFFNTPARIKFLNKPVQEQRYIADALKSIILANPHISFSLTANGESILRHESGDLLDAIYSVFDAQTAQNMLPVEYDSQNGVSVRGYASKPDFVKSSRAYQTVIVNGRAVTDQTVTIAAEKAYAEYLMKRKFPCFVLDVIIPFDEVDVNVHPAKTEVRFRDKHSVFSAVFRAVERAIKAAAIPGINFSPYEKAADAVDTDLSNSVTADDKADNSGKTGNTPEGSSDYPKNKQNAANKPGYEQIKLDTQSLYSLKKPPAGYKGDYYGTGFTGGYGGSFVKESQSGGYSHSYNTDIINKKTDEYFGNKSASIAEFDSDRRKKSAETFGNISADYSNELSDETANGALNSREHILSKGFGRIEKDFTQSSQYKSASDKENFNVNAADNRFDGSIIGQAFSTYLIIERDEKLYIIDQHAAHERILYDKLVEKLNKQYSQPLLIPYKFKLSAVESEYFDKIIPSLNNMGFEIEYKFGNYLVHAMPEPVAEMSFRRFVSELFNSMLQENELKLADIVKEEICQKACKAAIKGGDKLSREQIEYVIRNLAGKDGNLPEKCPHGRPCVVTLNKRDLEKMFKRIV